MRIRWNEQTIEWFQNASEYTGYNRKLAELLMEQIPDKTTLCDVGCGAALVDFALAPYFGQITCVDISPVAAEAVAARSRRLGVSNVAVLCTDAVGLQDRWDTVISLFHGGSSFFTNYFRLARQQLILTTYMKRKGNFGPEGRKAQKRHDVEETKARLDALGVKYTFREHCLEYGQPLRTWEEARDFVTSYTMPMSRKELDAYLEESLQKTGREDFPYYLPNQKRFGMFVIRRNENQGFE